MTQLEFIVQVAKRNGGLVSTTLARYQLVAAGLVQNPKNSYTIVSQVIIRSDRFERVARGLYRLKESS